MTHHDDPRAILNAACARIATPEYWSQGAGIDGNALCASLAFYVLDDCDWIARLSAVRALAAAAGLSSSDEIPAWNDAPETTHADVMAAFDLAREALDANRERA